MGILTRKQKRTEPQFNLSDTFLQSALYSDLSKSVSVNKQSALSIPAFSNGVKVLSQLCATLPPHMYMKSGNSKEKATYHYLYRILNLKPNNYMTSFDYWELIIRDLILEGNSYSLIERGGKYNDIIALHPLTAEYVVKEWNVKLKQFRFIYTNGSATTIYPQSDIWHIKNSGDGIRGLSIIEQFKDVIKQALVIEKFTTDFFLQGPSSHIMLETPDGMPAPKEDSIKKLRNFWRRTNQNEDKHIGIPPIL